MTQAAPSAPPADAVARQPTLPELIGARRARIVALAAMVAIVLGALAYVVLSADENAQTFARTDPPAFNLRHSPSLPQRAAGSGQLLRLQADRGGLFLQSFVVRKLQLPPYRGAVSGALPAFSTRYRVGLARRYEGFVALEEGKIRANGNPGYAIGFRAKLGARTLWGREVLVVPNQPGARDGVVMTLLQTAAAGAHSVADVGVVGALKKPYRSLRFGSATRGDQ